MSKTLKSNFFLFLAAIIWGFAFVAQVNLGDLGANTFLASRSFLATLTMIPIILIFEREKLTLAKIISILKYGAITGTILFIASILQQIGIDLNQSAGKAGFITSLYSIIVPILAFVLFKKKSNILIWSGAIISVIGLYLLSMPNGFTSIEKGDIFILIGAFFWAFHILSIDKFVGKVSPIKYSMVQFFTCGVWALIFALVFEDISFTYIQNALGSIVYCGVMSSGVAYTSQIIGQKDANPTVAPIILSTESIFSAIGGMIFLNETMPFKGYIGCVLMFAGVVISQLKINKKEA